MDSTVVAVATRATVALRVILVAGFVSIFGWSTSQGVEQVDLVVVGAVAGQSSETVNRMVLTAHSEVGDTEYLQAFQDAGAEAVELLAQIEDKSLAGAPLSETRAEFERVVTLVARAHHLVTEGQIELGEADLLELRELFAALEQKYYPRRSQEVEIPTP